MKIIFNSLALAFIFVIFSCRELDKKEHKEISNIKKVTVAFTGFGCEGRCPFQALSIDSSFAVKFYGGSFAKKNGFYTGTIDKEVWENVQTRFEKFTKVGVDTTDYQKTDHPGVEFIIDTESKIYRFKENTGGIAENDLNTLYWYIQLLSKTKNLNKTDTLSFDTSIQFDMIRLRNINK